jgi:phage baseplate assembly protein W
LTNAGAVTLSDIRSADWSLKLGAIGDVVEGIADIEQCLAVILTTPKGSDVLRPTFGADLFGYIDSPMTVAIPAIVREVSAAIAIWEPRVSLISVQVAPASDATSQAGAHLSLRLKWQLKLTGTSQQTTIISLPGGAP